MLEERYFSFEHENQNRYYSECLNVARQVSKDIYFLVATDRV